MLKKETSLLDCYIIEPDKFGDSRGYYSPYFIQNNFDSLGFMGVVQASRSKSSKGVVRGLHFQNEPFNQAKIVEVIKGSAIDVVVDMREDSNTFGKWESFLLTENNNKQLFVPHGFAHGFVSLEDDTIFQYLVDNSYAPDQEGGILWNDPDIGINWNEIFKKYDIESPNLSEKDVNRNTLKECKTRFRRND